MSRSQLDKCNWIMGKKPGLEIKACDSTAKAMKTTHILQTENAENTELAETAQSDNLPVNTQ